MGWLSKLFRSKNFNTLNNIIAPEIKDDEFYELLATYAKNPSLKSFLEIGSSSGGGSTEAFVTAIRSRADKDQVSLYCMEVSSARFELLRQAYMTDAFVKPYNVTSIRSDEFPSREAVIEFYNSVKTNLNHHELSTVLGWLQADIDYIQKSQNDVNGIELIKSANSIQQFDMVLIDGSEFSGETELNYVIGAKVIALDDTETYKCFNAFQTLKNDQRYKLVAHNPKLRNGYAVFELQSFGA